MIISQNKHLDLLESCSQDQLKIGPFVCFPPRPKPQLMFTSPRVNLDKQRSKSFSSLNFSRMSECFEKFSDSTSAAVIRRRHPINLDRDKEPH